MEIPATVQKNFYSVWAVPPEDTAERIQKLINGLRLEFGGPQFEPHITVVGAVSLTEQDAIEKFRSACNGLKAYTATVDRVGAFASQCPYLQIRPTSEVVEASETSIGHFGYKRSIPYKPHISLLYGDHLTDDEKKQAEEMVSSIDGSINGLSFEINRLQLWKTDPEDKTLKSWEKIAESILPSN